MRSVSREYRVRTGADVSMEMGLYRCLPQLVKTGMGAYKSPTDLEKDRPLVVGARVWLAVGAAYHGATNTVPSSARWSSSESRMIVDLTMQDGFQSRPTTLDWY
jgi:hypothetical protein